MPSWCASRMATRCALPPYQDRAQYPLPALLLLDIKLPRRNGIEVLRWLRSQPGEIRRLPVIMFTSSNHMRDVNDAYDAHVNSYLVKPVSLNELVRMMQVLNSYWLQLNQQPE